MNRKTDRLAHSIKVTLIGGIALCTMAVTASASVITYNTNSSGTGFVVVGGTTQTANLTINSVSGDAATLTFTPNLSSTTGTPSNIDLGDFLITCATCTSATPGDSFFPSFTFHLVISDTTDGATGQFVGTFGGGDVNYNTSNLEVDWQNSLPQTLGPNTNSALTGNFGQTIFDLVSPISLLVAPNSGTPPGDTTIQGQVKSSVPEPGTFGLAAGIFAIGYGAFKRRKIVRS